jgi:multiple sugar transport system substrate-binding protein
MSSTSPISRRALLHGAGGLAAAGALAATAGCGSNTGRDGGRTINQWYHSYGEKGTLQAAQRYAKAYQKASVRLQWIPTADYGDKLASGLLSSSGPDVFEDQINYSLVKAKQVVPLDDIIDPVKDDFTAGDLKLNTIDGKLYGIRMIDDPQFLYYRRSLLSAAGVTPPTTFDELTDAARRLTTKKVKGLFLGNDGGVGALAVPSLWAAGTAALSDAHTSQLTGDGAVAAATALRRLYATNSLLLGAPTDWFDPAAFLQGLTAMQWCGLWAMPAIQQRFPDDFGVIPLPAIGGAGKQVVYNGGWTAFVSSKAKDVDAAKAYLKWLWIDQTGYQQDWALSYGFHIPPRRSIAAGASKLQSGPAADVVKMAGTYGVGDNPVWTVKMNTALTDALTNVVRQGKPAAAQLATAQTTVDSELKRLFG